MFNKKRYLNRNKGQWILCEEGFSEKDESVLAQVNGKYKNVTLENALEIAVYGKDTGWELEAYPYMEDFEVIAWQPLPEPYRGQLLGSRR